MLQLLSIHEDKEGNLWVGTDAHLYLIKGENNISEIKLTSLPFSTDYFRVLLSVSIRKDLVGYKSWSDCLQSKNQYF